ncbi:RNA methyltransferase [Nonomuraea dietziae]
MKAARRLTKRAFREQDRKFLAEGPQAVREALKLDGVVVELFTTAEAELRHGDLITEATLKGLPVHRASGEVMAEAVPDGHPAGAGAVCGLVHTPLEEAVTERAPGWWRCSRTCATQATPAPSCAPPTRRGADSVVFTDASVEPYNGKCVRASAGSLFHLPVVIGSPVGQAVQRLKDSGLRVLAADGSGKHTLDDVELSGPTAWVFGNEAWGFPRRCWRWPTTWCGCPSTARPRASTWPPPRPCACTPRPGPSARADRPTARARAQRAG